MHEFAAPQSPIDVQSPVGATLVMPTAGEQLRLMHVHAHPDDESSKGAASNADSGRMPVGKPAIIFNDYSRIDPITAQKTKDMVITSVNFDGVTGQLKSQT